MDVDKDVFDWGNGCIMRGVGKDVKACDVRWVSKQSNDHRVAIINRDGLLCDEVKSPLPASSRVCVHNAQPA
jgi:hypothetical protein